jgi:hypothetical protein
MHKYYRLLLSTALLASVLPASASIFTWNGTGSGNWSVPGNWSPTGLPSAADEAVLGTSGESPSAGAADNTVDIDFTLQSLWFAPTNLSPNFAYQNTQINAGVTLSVNSTNAEIVFDSGTQNDPFLNTGNGGLAASYSAISGSGTLTVTDSNAASVMIVSQGSSQYSGKAGLWASLDMSGLSTFNGTFGRLLAGVQGDGPVGNGAVALNNSGRQAGELSLAMTNNIHLTQTGNIQGTADAAVAGAALVINDAPFFGDNGSEIFLGVSNAIWADTITVGRQQCNRTALMEFNPEFSAPQQIYLRGESSNRVSEFVIADNTVNGATGNANPGVITVPPGGFSVGSAGLFDVSAGTSDIMIDALIIGKGYQFAGGGYAAGAFNMGAGSLNVNTLQLGVMSSASETAPVTGVLNDAGGAITVNSGSVALGVELASPASTFATGTLVISGGGSLDVANGGIVDDGLSESQVLLTNAIVTAANIGSASAPIGTLVVGDSTLNVSVSGLEGAILADNISTVSSLTGVTINLTSISGVAAQQTVITLIQSQNPISYSSIGGGVGGTDLILGGLPAGYQGHLQINLDSVQLVLTQNPTVPDGWTGADISIHDTNWSDSHNWSLGSEPSANVPAAFSASASAASSALSSLGGGPGAVNPAKINNIVDTSVGVLGVNYGNINGTYENTSINPGVTLTLGSGGLTVGSPVIDEGNTTANATISGSSGTLAVNDNSAVLYVGLGHASASSSASATLDMSGLGAFNVNAGSLLIGVGSVGFTSVLQPAGAVYLAETNSLTLTAGNGQSDSALVALDVGDAGDAETQAGYGASSTSALYLGWSNNIQADYIDVGRQWANGKLAFNPAVTNSSPSVVIRGASANPVVSLNIGDGAENTLPAGGGSGTVDLTGGTANILVNTLNVGKSSPNCIAPTTVTTGTLTFNSGLIAASTVNISDNPANSGSYVSPAAGVINVNGAATLVASSTLNLGLTPGAQAGGTPSAILNVNGGSVWANNVVAGTNGTVSAISLVGATFGATNGIAAASAPVTTLNLTNSTIIAAASSGPVINAESVNAGGSSNTVILLSLPPVEVYPLVVTLVNSANPISGSLNFQAQLPSSYSGIAVSYANNHSQVILTIQNGPISARGIVHWIGPAGINMNWSDSANWFLPPIPAAPDIAMFDNVGESLTAGVAGADNVADVNVTIAGLLYAATNDSVDFALTPAAYQNTVINPGVTVTVNNTNPVIVLDSGTQNDPTNSSSGNGPVGNTSSYATISGGGTLSVNDPNPESVAIVSQGSSQYSYPSASLWAQLDMSGLNSFNGTFGRLLVGIQGVGATAGEVALNASGRQTGLLWLAATNVIHLTQTGNTQGGFAAAAGGPALVVFDSGFSGDNPSEIHLGLSNAIYADTITIGRTGVQSGVMDFNPNLITDSSIIPQLWLRGQSASRVSEMIIADSTYEGGNSQYENPDSRILVTPAISGGNNEEESSLMDLSAGTVNMMVDTLIVGQGCNTGGSGFVVGQLSIGGGALNANALELGAMTSSATVTPVTGILNITNATLTVNNSLALGVPMGGATASYAAGNLNLSGVNAAVGSITASGSVNSSINMTGGSLTLTSAAGSIGTSAAPVGSITLSGGTILNLAAGAFPAVVAGSISGSGSADTINISYLPPMTTLPATVTLIQSQSGIGSYDFVLGTLPTGFHGTLQESTDNTAVQLVITSSTTPPAKGATITHAGVTAGSITLSGTNGLSDAVYYVLSSTNLAAPHGGWSIIATNAFDASGNFNLTLPATATQQFFRIESQ